MSKHFKTLTIPFADPFDFISDDPIADATEAYGDWPEVDTPCRDAPAGQCEFTATDPDHCMWCGRRC